MLLVRRQEMLFSLRKVPWTDCLYGLELRSLALRHDEYYVKKHPLSHQASWLTLLEDRAIRGAIFRRLTRIPHGRSRTNIRRCRQTTPLIWNGNGPKQQVSLAFFTLSAQAKLNYPKWVATGQHYHTERQLEDILWPICDRSYLVAEVTLVKTRKQSNFADGDDRACYVHILTMWNLLICIYRRSMDNYYPATPEYISRVCIIRTPDKTKLAYD